MEIRSPGLLFGGLTIERIRKEKVSERRNELIAQMLHLIHFVENWGKGISKILKLEPKTEFKEIGRKFYTIFHRKPTNTENGVEKGVERLSDNEKKIIRLIKKNPSISKKEIVKKGNLSKKAVEYNIERLKQKGLIKRVGPAKGGHWEIQESHEKP